MSIEMSTEMSGFNASIQVTELLMKTLENAAKALACRCVTELAARHGFNAEEEIRLLGLENLSLIRKAMAKKSGSKVSTDGTKKEKKPREAKEKKSVFPLPFICEQVDLAGCQGLAYNRGLFTQCKKNRMENGQFCSFCQKDADKSALGLPQFGTLEQRMSCGLYDFKDPKGRSPVSYLKVLEKLNLTADAAVEEAGKLNLEIDNDHFAVAGEKSKKSKGRPKKTGKIQADGVNDMFKQLTYEGEQEEIEGGEEKPVKSSKSKLTDAEKALKKQALEAERAIKKAEREEKLAQEKAEREEKRKAEAEQKKLEKEQKMAIEKAEREEKRLAEKAEREAKKMAEKAEKAEKGTKKTKVAVPAPVVAPVDAPVVAPVDAPIPVVAPVDAPVAKVSVTRIQISGKAYLKSSNNILYDPNTKEEVGVWDPITKTIKELPDDDEEEEEEEYESDN